MATTVLVFISGFGTSAWAQEFRSRERDVWGPRYKGTPQLRQAPRHRSWLGVDAVRRWNEITLNANALDHTPVTPGENREDFREQLGPLRTARAFAIVHIGQGYWPYRPVRSAHACGESD